MSKPVYKAFIAKRLPPPDTPKKKKKPAGATSEGSGMSSGEYDYYSKKNPDKMTGNAYSIDKTHGTRGSRRKGDYYHAPSTTKRVKT